MIDVKLNVHVGHYCANRSWDVQRSYRADYLHEEIIAKILQNDKFACSHWNPQEDVNENNK